ncbi:MULTISPECIES: SHOCT domain-containing protein [Aerococcaceae]|uniref:SHOCT-like domain-containing protein n=1 Tax=Fundicoccus ignavus TaxID=2664442 RepID=A0A844CD16_9LACT|nr:MULTISPECIES: SHOCT domain-containing protein [Aerococcaceae]MBG9980433.1 hypothetical protein [Facklamia lactis]MRJ47070.1 hypothetical protein [Fundicoccus ignavus]
MFQELSIDKAMNEIQFAKSLQVITKMKEEGLISLIEFKEIKIALIELYRPYLAELML